MKKLTIRIVSRRVERDIAAIARQGFVASGLASEGYQGGYRDALQDVLLFMRGIRPTRRDWWLAEGEEAR